MRRYMFAVVCCLVCLYNAHIYLFPVYIILGFALSHSGCDTRESKLCGRGEQNFCQKYEKNFCRKCEENFYWKYERNSIIPDMSFRPHLLNDLRSLENNRGMSKVTTKIFRDIFFFYFWSLQDILLLEKTESGGANLYPPNSLLVQIFFSRR